MEDQIRNSFESNLKNLSFSEEEKKFKQNNLDQFLKQGFPSKRLENWKFSDLKQIIKSNIGELNYHNDFSKKKQNDKINLIDDIEHNKVIIIDGKVETIDFNYEEKANIKILADQTPTIELKSINSLINLNNAFANRSLKLVIKKDYLFKKPLIIYHSINKNTELKNINSRIDFHLEENSCLKVIDVFNETSEKNFTNIYYNFLLDKNSILKNFKIDVSENNNIKYSFNNITQQANSISESFVLSKGSKFLKNEINCDLKGEHASAFVNGIFDLNNDNHHEIKSNINHLVENTKSYQLVKSVLDKNSKSVYQGKIFVSPEAQKTDGYQLSNAILLSENSEFNAKPELEIYADDVKCSHGSSSGSLDENSIFYLMTRGLSYNEAKKLLINGYLLDVIEKITDSEIKNLIKNMIGLKE